VAVGVAVVLSHKVHERPVVGDQVKFVPCLACNLAIPPRQSAATGSIVTLAGGRNLIKNVSLLHTEAPTTLIIDIVAVSDIFTLVDAPDVE